MERSVALRRARQARLAGEPIQRDAVIGEGALRQTIGGAGVMREQLQRLTELSELLSIDRGTDCADAAATGQLAHDDGRLARHQK